MRFVFARPPINASSSVPLKSQLPLIMFGMMTMAMWWMRWDREPVDIGENRKSDPGGNSGPNTGKNRMPTTPTDFN